MVNSKFNNVKIKGIKTVVPQKYIDIDDEIQYFENNPKKLARTKKMVGFGRRHVLDEGCTVVDLCEQAAKELIKELKIDKDKIEALVMVNQSPDYLHPASSAILHGKLGLKKTCTTLDLGLGCSGYVYGLWMVHSLIASGAVKNVLFLAGDSPSQHSDRRNRLVNQIFGDAGSATYIEYTEEDNTAYFSLGTDGTGWDRIIAPASAKRLQLKSDICDKEIEDKNGNIWKLNDTIIHGQDVFNFTIEVAPQNIKDVMEYAQKTDSDIDYYVIHQANKQIVESVAIKADIPDDKYSSQTFSKYGNNSTTSVATVICDQLEGKKYNTILLSAFGVGLSWASAIININNLYNGGISYFIPPENMLTREEQIQYWIKQFKGE